MRGVFESGRGWRLLAFRRGGAVYFQAVNAQTGERGAVCSGPFEAFNLRVQTSLSQDKGGKSV